MARKLDFANPSRNKVVRKGVSRGEAAAYRMEAKQLAKRVASGKLKAGEPVKVFTPEEIAEFERNRKGG